MANIEFGYIYVASNEAFKDGIYKIGYTGGKVEDRLNQLYSTNVPMPFKEEFSIFVPFPNKIEERLHYELAEYRYNDSREFFKCSLEYISKKISELTDFMEDMWTYIIFGLGNFLNIAGKSLSDDFINGAYISGFSKESEIENQIEEEESLYIKDGQVYYSEVKVCLGTIENIKKVMGSKAEE